MGAGQLTLRLGPIDVGSPLASGCNAVQGGSTTRPLRHVARGKKHRSDPSPRTRLARPERLASEPLRRP
jgi:hypothetical protein